MNRSSITAIAVACVAVPIVLLQRSQNAKLQTETQSLRTSLEESQRAARDGYVAGLDSRGAAAKDGAKRGEAGRVTYRAGTVRDILAGSDPMDRVRALLAYVEGIDPADIPAAMKELREGSPEWDPDARMLAHLLLTRWAQEDPEGALASLEGSNAKQSRGEATSILAAIAGRDPKRAVEWLADPENTLALQPWMGQILAGTVAKEWVRQDPEAALAWAQLLPKNQRSGALSGLLATMASSDPERASTLAMNLDPGEARRNAVGEIAKVWAQSAPEEAAEWARSLEEDDQRRALGQAVEAWAQSEPGAAAAYIDGMESEEAGRYLTTVAGNWARQDPPQAAEWVASQPEGDGKNDAMGHVMWNWTNRDYEAAGEWLGGQPEGPARDRGITGLAKAAFETDREAALGWAANISDDELRTNSVNIGLTAWRAEDSAAAEAWAVANGIAMPERRDGEGKD